MAGECRGSHCKNDEVSDRGQVSKNGFQERFQKFYESWKKRVTIKEIICEYMQVYLFL
jgi:hypothetical protein